MSERTVYISPYQLGALIAFGDAINSNELFRDRDPINADAIVYGSMIQCGVEKFELPKGFPYKKESGLSQSEFLKARISNFPGSKGIKSQDVVRSAFSRFLPPNYHQKEEFFEVARLEPFLTDLIFAAEHKISYMTLFPIPDVTKLESQLPPEILFPVKNLLNSFESLNPSLPYPKLSAKSTDINRFEELLNSDLFSRYVSRHGELEGISVSTKNAVKHVIDGGKDCYKKTLISFS